jgi:hypothetical protein
MEMQRSRNLTPLATALEVLLAAGARIESSACFSFCRGQADAVHVIRVEQDLPLAGKLAKLLEAGLLVPGM